MHFEIVPMIVRGTPVCVGHRFANEIAWYNTTKSHIRKYFELLTRILGNDTYQPQPVGASTNKKE